MPDMDEILSVSQASSELGISREAVYAAIREGRLQSVNILGKLGIERHVLESYHPQEIKIRAAKERAADFRFARIEHNLGYGGKFSLMLVNISLIQWAHYPLPGESERAELPPLKATFADSQQIFYPGTEGEVLFRLLRQKPNIREMHGSTGVYLLNLDYVRAVDYRSQEINEDQATLFIDFGGKGPEPRFEADEAEAVWKYLSTNLNIHS
jgi:hypothetical protein